MSVAKRGVANEMDVSLGKHWQVEYSIRFEDMTEPGATFSKYMTDSLLLREAMNDPKLERLSKRRKDLKVPDRIQPVEIFYAQKPELDYVEVVIRTVLMVHRAEEPGDILHFLTERKRLRMDVIRSRSRSILYLRQTPNRTLLDLSPASFFSTPTEKRYIRSCTYTTYPRWASRTENDIEYVIDPSNKSFTTHGSGFSPTSKASAQKRAGRAGRPRPGKYFGLYTQKDFWTELEGPLWRRSFC
ncbi:hypothetical protein BGW80DRAFT_1462738 [Lactifluus volemus]|nr:hypothetical protein BGW80DRAFT_1462738 [Lactifluus volemus]